MSHRSYRWASAHGPGIHTDEASSALNALAEEGLSERAWTVLHDASEGVRQNPSKSTARKEIVIGPQRELFLPAMLITGQWGVERTSLVRSLPVVRDNPAHPERIEQPFRLRMQMLLEELAKMQYRFEIRYTVKGVFSPAMRDWVDAVETMTKAVRYVLKEFLKPAKKRSILSKDGFLGLPAKAWNPLAAEGNSKLPYVAYSELPMATCPGAGACGVSLGAFDVITKDVPALDKAGKPMVYKTGPKKGLQRTRRVEVAGGPKGWCYSFTAWRYPDAYARQFLNTLANYADREFAILAAGGPEEPRRHAERFEAAINNPYRRWIRAIGEGAMALTKNGRKVKPAFMRLFVDGDINHEDCIVEWMEMCRRVGPGGSQVPAGESHLEVYGYTKSWNQFVNVDRRMGSSFWPKNYVVNLSSGSVYASSKFDATRDAMERLTVSRGYFEAINLDRYLPILEEQAKAFASSPDDVVPMPKPTTAFRQFKISPERVKKFLLLNEAKTVEDVQRVVPGFSMPANRRRADAAEIRKRGFHAWFATLTRNPEFGSLLRRELARDEGRYGGKKGVDEQRFYEELERRYLDELRSNVVRDDFSENDMTKKTFALLLHEVLWTYGQGGSCPLICGNCSDDPNNSFGGVHRCAAKPGSPFWHSTIHIGLH